MAGITKYSSSQKALRSLLRRGIGCKDVTRRQSKLRVERLEDRRLLAADGYHVPGQGQYPEIGLITGEFVDADAREWYASQVAGPYGPDYGNPYAGSNYGGGSGLTQPVLVNEAEPNNTLGSAQFIGLSSASDETSTQIVHGSLASQTSFSDVDYYSAQLRGGDILDLRINSVDTSTISIELLDVGGQLLFTTPFAFGSPYSGGTTQSPLSTDGDVSFGYVIPSDGLYHVRVSGGVGLYVLESRVYRNTIENEPIGTMQELFLDFDGVTNLDLTPWGMTGTTNIPSVYTTLANYGYSTADVNAFIDNVIATVEKKFRSTIAPAGLGNNGDYANDGEPGNFGFRITNSRDHGDRFGLPYVTRGIVGGSAVDFFGDPAAVGILGIANSIDIGNFEHEDQFITLVDNFYALGINNAYNIAPGRTEVEMMGSIIGNTTAHEFGHILGAWHTNTFSAPFAGSLMDVGANLKNAREIGPDGTFGTADDTSITFIRKDYDLALPFFGVENQAASVSFALSTGTRGGTVNGFVFSDLNRNGSKQSNEFGIAGQTVYADINQDGVYQAGEPSAKTAGDGTYSLRIGAGTYNIRSVPVAGMSVSKAFVTVTVGLDQVVNNVNLGQFVSSQTITGFKWADLNGNGARDEGEPGIGGVYIYADFDGDDRPDLAEPGAFTNADGSYVLTAPVAAFAIREVVTPGFIQTFPTAGEHTITASTVRPLSGYDFGNQPARDYGDLPEPYRTTVDRNGANAGIVPGFSLGANIDLESDGVPSVTANGDDVTSIDDEDGVLLLQPIVLGSSTNRLQITVNNGAGTTGYVSAWMDFNGDGDFDDNSEKIVSDASAETRVYTFTAPRGTGLPGNVYSRFRLSGAKGQGPNGAAQFGEVEDYRFQTLTELVYSTPDFLSAARNSADNVFDVLTNDPATRLEGFTATIESVFRPSRGGSVTTDGTTITYTPAQGFVGRETFKYRLKVSNGATVDEIVTVDVNFRSDVPEAIDDSFDVAVNASKLQLDVLANDVEGLGGDLIIQSVSRGNANGTINVSPNSRKIIYSPASRFEGTETFTYIARDSTGATSQATVTVHVLPGDRTNDTVEFSLQFRDLGGNIVTQIPQGDDFYVDIIVDDLRTNPGANPGVYAAFLDLLYNSNLVLPTGGIPGSSFDFNVRFFSNYTTGQTGSSDLPGIIDELGAINSNTTIDQANPQRLATLRFNARSAGIATFIPDPADSTPGSDVVFANDANNPVPEIRTRYLRSALQIIPDSNVFPQAIDDSPTRVFAVKSARNIIDVLNNDVEGANGPLRLIDVSQPAEGVVTIDDNGTPNNPIDDVLRFTAGSTRGVQTFTYTVVDSLGYESRANVTVQVGNISNYLVRLRLEVTDEAGNPITQIGVNEQFQLRGYVEDVSGGTTDPGVFAAYQDILFSDATLATVNAANNALGFEVSFLGGGKNYFNSQSGDIRIPGLINEIGSQQTNQSDAIGPGEFLQFVVTLTAKNIGTLSFIGDPADLFPNSDTLLYNLVAPIDSSRINYTDTVISIVQGTSAGAGEGFQNQLNRFDVNNDGYVSAIDVLAIVNVVRQSGFGSINHVMTAGGEGEAAAVRRNYVDVDNDSYLTALDVLAIVNYINAARRSTALGEGEATNANDDALASFTDNDFADAVSIDIDQVKKGTRA